MRIFAIADSHLSRAQPKPMDIFGGNWQGHPEVFFERWQEVVTENDVVLVPGDISWAMKLEQAALDLADIADLPGKKVLLRGNHDYWWSGIGKVRKALPEGMAALQNDALLLNDWLQWSSDMPRVVIAGTRGWDTPHSSMFSEQDEKIYVREQQRLKLSLEQAKKLVPDVLVVMLHYPPTNLAGNPSGFTDILQEYTPDVVMFGHLHGYNKAQVLPHMTELLAPMQVYFVAADALEFYPEFILEI